MSKIWKIKEQKFDSIEDQILFNRGLKTKGEIEDFLNPSLKNYQNDLEIPGIKKAQDRIKKAIENEELILVYADYDVDGICAATILYKALTSIGAKVLPYIPHREKEGYGMSKIGLDKARDSGASLVITVDNGIVALEQARYAKEIGLDLIITDHHMSADEKPEALAIVHSIKMCGASVAWCLISELIKKDEAEELLQFAAIATVCDLIPLIGLGRAFLVEGLKELNKTQNLGLKALFLEAGISPGSIGSYEIGHMIGPRLNAIGRLDHAIDALRLMCTKDPKKARDLARLLTDKNLERQQLTITAVEEADLQINKGKKIHVLKSEKWIPGIIGLIAGRVTESYSRPSIAMSINGEVAKGSARSIEGVNIVEVIRTCSDILIDIGGHKGAAGFSIETKNIDEFIKRLEKELESVEVLDEPVLEVDLEIEKNKLTKRLAESLEKFKPFGFQNPQPIFVCRGMRISDLRTLKDGKHLKFKAEGIDVIGFGMGNFIDLLANGQLVDLAFNLEINKFNGAQILQLRLKDCQPL